MTKIQLVILAGMVIAVTALLLWLFFSPRKGNGSGPLSTIQKALNGGQTTTYGINYLNSLGIYDNSSANDPLNPYYYVNPQKFLSPPITGDAATLVATSLADGNTSSYPQNQ